VVSDQTEILLLTTSPLSTTTPSLATISSSSSTIPSSSLTDSSLSPSISPSLATISSPSLLPIEVNPINKRLLCHKRPSILSDHNYNLQNNHKIPKTKNLKSRSKHSVQYLSNWKKQPEAQYKTCFWTILVLNMRN
jgi:hypothetical protein